jgi:hypothetical protein
MIKTTKKLWTIPSFININNGMSQPTYSNNKEDVLKKFKKNIRGLFTAEEMERLFLLICLENQNAGKTRFY